MKREWKWFCKLLTAIEHPIDCFVDLFIVRDWICLVPPTAAVAGLGYVSYLAFCPEARKSIKVVRVNKSIRLEDAKVADFVDIEDIADKAAFCRCWKSKNVSQHTANVFKKTHCYYDYGFHFLSKKRKS